MEQLLASAPLRQDFARLGDRILIAWDGTEYFCSQKLGCPHCLRRKRANGKVESYHTLLAATAVAPGHSKVVPLFPEFIARRTAPKNKTANATPPSAGMPHADRLRPLRPVYLGDDLFACQPIVTMLADAGDDFIFTCKESSHKALCDFIDGAEPERHVETIRKGKAIETRRYRWITGVPLRDGKDAALVNWIACEIFDRHHAVKYSIAWVTSLPVGKANVADIAAAGRARWKIENETFNVMKNHGYELEHNFGHGETFLAMTLAALNLLAFACHTALDIVEPTWQAARQAAAKRSAPQRSARFCALRSATCRPLRVTSSGL